MASSAASVPAASVQSTPLRSRLASLSASEIEYACRAFSEKRGHPVGLAYYEVTLLEPFSTEQKAAAFRGETGAMPPRRARIVAAEGQGTTRTILEGHAPVDATSPALVFLRERSNVQPPITADEYALCERLVLAHPGFRQACRARGINPSDVRVDPWCVGHSGPEHDPSRRLAEPLLYLQRGDPAVDSLYMQPLEGFDMVIDLWEKRISSFSASDDAPPPPAPEALMRFPRSAAQVPSQLQRPPLPPLSISQPEGGGFHLGNDGALAWQGWEGVISFTPREGAVLSALKYAGRPVAWRLSFAEMVVPYGDPHPPHWKKAAFDAGEDGLGRNIHSLDPSRCDCAPGAAAAFLDAAIASESGGADLIKNAICVHEEDSGLLWKHLDWRTGEATARRGRRLTIMFLCTVANYTYGFSYKLGLDASIELEATLTGILSIGALHPPTAPSPRVAPHRPWGQTLSPSGLYAPDHQHFFVARCDMAVDGLDNRVVEMSVEPAATSTYDAEDQYALRHRRHNAFRRRRRVLSSERQAARNAMPQIGRHWLIESTRRTNRVGEPTAWRLEPGSGSAIALACDPAAHFLDRGGFLRRNLWVSAYHPEERFPGGEYPNQRPPSMPDGLPHWTERDSPLDGADIILWHVFGVTHVVRTEDAPVMPSEHVSFRLAPHGFFDVSPCTDVPCDACEKRGKQTASAGVSCSGAQDALVYENDPATALRSRL
jgi:primary-amine oxidase